jgi:hypothetical protein
MSRCVCLSLCLPFTFPWTSGLFPLLAVVTKAVMDSVSRSLAFAFWGTCVAVEWVGNKVTENHICLFWFGFGCTEV